MDSLESTLHLYNEEQLETFSNVKPFLKWAGGKTQLLPEIFKRIPKEIENADNFTYVEPFVGSGAVFFKVMQKYSHSIEHAIINDINSTLIGTYRNIKNNPYELIELLTELKGSYLKKNESGRKTYFYDKRNEFNNIEDYTIQKSALMIFLNKTCFNGLYRVNKSGGFNVPHGSYKNPEIFNSDLIMAIHILLQKVEIQEGDYTEANNFNSKMPTLYYLDPPYKPLTESSSFNSYSKNEFDDAEQLRLKDFCDIINRNGASFILSNSDMKNINENNNYFDELYNNFTIKRVKASRRINSIATKRGDIFELLITNEV